MGNTDMKRREELWIPISHEEFSGCSYCGNLISRKMNGFGKLRFFKEGQPCMYRGNFKNNEFNGKGELQTFDKDGRVISTEKGFFKDSMKHGICKIIDDRQFGNEICVGYFKNNKLNGPTYVLDTNEEEERMFVCQDGNIIGNEWIFDGESFKCVNTENEDQEIDKKNFIEWKKEVEKNSGKQFQVNLNLEDNRTVVEIENENRLFMNKLIAEKRQKKEFKIQPINLNNFHQLSKSNENIIPPKILGKRKREIKEKFETIEEELPVIVIPPTLDPPSKKRKVSKPSPETLVEKTVEKKAVKKNAWDGWSFN